MHHLLNLLVPRRNNGHHPHLISRGGVALMLLLAVGAIGLSLHQHSTAVLGDQMALQPIDLLDRVNRARTEQGKTSLAMNSKLASAAFAKGNDMLEQQYWAHISPSGVTPWSWMRAQQYSYAYAGENLARNFANADATVAAWMASPAHRDNMLNDYYTEAGFAVVDGELKGKPVSIVVALFATPASSFASVAGATTTQPDTGTSLGVFARIGIAVQSMNTSMLGIVTILLVGLLVAGVTFASTHLGMARSLARAPVRNKRGSWHQHHTVTKSITIATLLVVCTMLFSGGSL